jgi:hypothetical protein
MEKEVPMINYISRAEADELCDALIQEFNGQNVKNSKCVDIDDFVGSYLKCPVRYEDFVEEYPHKIGFVSNGECPIHIYENGVPVKQVYPKSTIVLAKFLLLPGEEKRRRFTLAHEAGHIIAAQIDPEAIAHFHHRYDSGRFYTGAELREWLSINEWQANILAAALLMPRFMLKDALVQHNGGHRLPIYGNHLFSVQDKIILRKMADTMGVSYTALVIRLRDLDALSYHNISEFILTQLKFGGAV